VYTVIAKHVGTGRGKIWMNQIPSPDLFSNGHEKAVHHLDK